MHALSKSLEIKPYMLNVEIYMLQETIMHDCHHRPRQRCQVVPHGLQRHRVTSVLMIRRVWSTGQHVRPPELRHPCKLPELRTTHLRQWRHGLSTQYQAQSNYDTWWWCCRACRCRLNCSCPLSSIDYSCSPDSRASFFFVRRSYGNIWKTQASPWKVGIIAPRPWRRCLRKLCTWTPYSLSPGHKVVQSMTLMMDWKFMAYYSIPLGSESTACS